MSTSYKTIYKRAAGVINSYKISHAIEESPITFFRIMYPFLLNAFGQITRPEKLVSILQHRIEPEHIIEDFEIRNYQKNIPLSFDVEINYMDSVFFQVYLDERLLDYSEYYYNEIDNEIVLTISTPEAYALTVEYYFCGVIVGTEKRNLKVELKDHSLQILTTFTLRNWLEKAKNRELTIQANISPRDYQMFSPANALKENRELYDLAYNNSYSESNALGWAARFRGSSLREDHKIIADIKSKNEVKLILYDRIYNDRKDLAYDFLIDFYEYSREVRPLVNFIHGEGTKGFEGYWLRSAATDKELYLGRIDVGYIPGEKTGFIGDQYYGPKWLPFFNYIDFLMLNYEDTSVWESSYTGSTRIQQYFQKNIFVSLDDQEERKSLVYPPSVSKIGTQKDYILPVPTKRKGEFLGWYDNPEFEGSPITKIKKGEIGRKTLYAKWATIKLESVLN